MMIKMMFMIHLLLCNKKPGLLGPGLQQHHVFFIHDAL